MKFKLVEDIELEEEVLNESTYGLTKEYSEAELKNMSMSGHLLPQILDSGSTLEPGFTVYSNSSGSGIQSVVNAVLHHLDRLRGSGTPVKLLDSSSTHNKIHSMINELIKDALNEYDSIFKEAYNQYYKKYREADSKLASLAAKHSKDFYNCIGLRFKAFEDYFRYIHYKISSKTMIDDLARTICKRIEINNVFNGLSYDYDEDDVKAVIKLNKEIQTYENK